MSNRKAVFTVSPRGEGKKDFWLRVGSAFENRDGSWSLVLDALPVNGKLIVREELPPDGARPSPQRDERPQQRRDEGGDGIPF